MYELKIVYLCTEDILITIVALGTHVAVRLKFFLHRSSITINTVFRYPARFDIVQAKFGIDLIRMKDVDKMKHHMETYFDASEKGKELEMTFIGVQEQCEAQNWPEGGVQILNLGHNLLPKSEVCTKNVRIKTALSIGLTKLVKEVWFFFTVMHHIGEKMRSLLLHILSYFSLKQVILRNLCAYYTENKSFDVATEYWKKLLTINAEVPSFHLGLVHCLVRLLLKRFLIARLYQASASMLR